MLIVTWSVWLLSLSVIPCCWEDDVCHREACVETTSSEADHPVGSPDKACSPFMLCGNCHGFISSQPARLVEEATPAVYHPADFFYATRLFPSIWLSSVWQPPRTSSSQ